ncbi:MAG: FAD-dependent oxidoreductase [Rhizobiaceae bacterium]|nr:FAD-dependent oxidoreductase [Rhizobiaceae bacterium]
MSKTITPDICVIGGGSGGLSVAAAAAAFGVEVVLLEKGKMGGDCLNYGCVPSKAIIAAGKHARAAVDGKKFGVHVNKVDVKFDEVNAHIKNVIAGIAPHDSPERFRSLGVNVIEQAGVFIDADTVQAGDTIIKARRYVIATGSSAFVPPIPGIDEVDYLINETIFEQTTRPDHLIVIGGGPIGMEMAQAHHRLGSKVTVVEGFKALGKDDPELAEVVLKRIREEGVEILEDTKVVKLSKAKSGVSVTVETSDGQRDIKGSHVLVATGRAANVNGLGLEQAQIEYDRRGIKVGANMRTSNKRVYAIGDVAGGFQFTHVAGYHAGLVVQQILFRLPAKENQEIIPWATYTEPELANVGLTEAQAREKYGDTISVLRWEYAENDRARAERKTDGLIKIVADKKGRLVGVAIAGAGAGEMINMWALAITNKMKLSNVRGYIPPYPTMSEIGKRAVMTHYGPITSKPFVRAVIGFLRKFG